MWLKKLTVFFLASGFIYILLLYINHHHPTVEEVGSSSREYHADLVFRLRRLDIQFHKFVALSQPREDLPDELQSGTAITSTISNKQQPHTTTQPHLLTTKTIPQVGRWTINSTYYKLFKARHKIAVKGGKCTGGPYKMVILVQSYITHKDRRASIRHTWGNSTAQNKNKWKVLFIIGTTTDEKHPKLIADEMNQHNDLLLVQTGESFYNLTEKLQKSFQWVAKHCDFHYLLKCDDDVFVNVAQLYKYLSGEKIPRDGLFTGQVMWWSEVYRSGRYAIDKGYKRTVYPRYCSGGGYVLSKDVVERFIGLFPRVPYMRIDDAYFGELALKAGLYIIHSDEFRMWTSNCDYKETGLVTHPVTTDECMKTMYGKAAIAFANIDVLNYN